MCLFCHRPRRQTVSVSGRESAFGEECEQRREYFTTSLKNETTGIAFVHADIDSFFRVLLKNKIQSEQLRIKRADQAARCSAWPSITEKHPRSPIKILGVSMPPEAWRMLNELRGSTSRGVWIRCRIWGVWQSSRQAGSGSKASLTPPS